MKKKISTLGTFWDFSPGLWVGVFETRYLGEFMGDLGRIYIGRKRRLRAFFLSWLCFACVIARNNANRIVLQVQETLPKEKTIYCPKKNTRKKAFLFFLVSTPQKT
jgi:hypothetical protein